MSDGYDAYARVLERIAVALEALAKSQAENVELATREHEARLREDELYQKSRAMGDEHNAKTREWMASYSQFMERLTASQESAERRALEFNERLSVIERPKPPPTGSA